MTLLNEHVAGAEGKEDDKSERIEIVIKLREDHEY